VDNATQEKIELLIEHEGRCGDLFFLCRGCPLRHVDCGTEDTATYRVAKQMLLDALVENKLLEHNNDK